MKAIWDIASFWRVRSEMAGLPFNKNDEARWEGRWEDLSGERVMLRAGLSQVIEMSEEEWQEELREYYSEDSDEDSEFELKGKLSDK